MFKYWKKLLTLISVCLGVGLISFLSRFHFLFFSFLVFCHKHKFNANNECIVFGCVYSLSSQDFFKIDKHAVSQNFKFKLKINFFVSDRHGKCCFTEFSTTTAKQFLIIILKNYLMKNNDDCWRIYMLNWNIVEPRELF